MGRMMKDSGFEWIGQIPQEWETDNIGSKYSERKTKVSDRDYQPLSVTMKGIVPQLETAAKSDAHDDRKLVCIGDFAINSRSDRRGSCGISKYEGSVSLINTILAPKGKMDPEYYDWLFHTTLFADEFYKWGHGIVDDLWTTNWSDMKKISIPVPPFDEQKRIADFLDRKSAEIDIVIKKTEESIEEYKKLKQSVITEAVTKGIRPSRKTKPSGIEWIGEIPEEWSVTRTGNLFRYSSGETLTSEMFVDDFDDTHIYPVYGANGIRGFYEKFNLEGKKILIGRVGALCGNIHLIDEKIWVTEHSLIARKINNVNEEFFSFAFEAMNLRQYSKASAQPVISSSTISMKRVPYPPLDEQKEIADFLDRKSADIDKLIEAKRKIIEELQFYKKSVIYEYVTGKKEV